jgi:hypothetical protein
VAGRPQGQSQRLLRLRARCPIRLHHGAGCCRRRGRVGQLKPGHDNSMRGVGARLVRQAEGG